MKASIYKIAQQSPIIDLHHEVPPQDIEQALFDLNHRHERHARRQYLRCGGRPWSGQCQKRPMDKKKGQTFIGPDNGCLSPAILEADEIREIDFSKFSSCSNTFHGRDVFGPLAAHTFIGNHLSFTISMTQKPIFIDTIYAKPSKNQYLGKWIKKDHYGNLISNCHRDQLKDWPKMLHLQMGPNTFLIQRYEHYSEIEDDDSLHLKALWGSSGYLELVVKNGSFYKTHPEFFKRNFTIEFSESS